MDIYTVRDNLKQTIAGKQAWLAGFAADENVVGLVRETMIQVIEMNLDELGKILADVEKCCRQAADASWKGSVDRQSGAFDDSEINRENW